MKPLEERRPTISVVLASPDGDARALDESLAALGAACEGMCCELIVVTASPAVAVSAALPREATVRTFTLPSGTLTPLLWAHGCRAAQGDIVAFTTAQCTVPRGWAHAAVKCIAAGYTGVGGALELAPKACATDRAVFHLRYSAFSRAPLAPECTHAHEIAGDNAAYRRDALLRHDASLDNGFWEVDFHRRLRAEGARLALSPAMTVRFGRAPSLVTLATQRFKHGRHSGAWRVACGVRQKWHIIAAAPLVPAVLLLRVTRRARGAPAGGAGELWSLFGALPALLVLSFAWAAGEAVGALLSGPDRGAGIVA